MGATILPAATGTNPFTLESEMNITATFETITPDVAQTMLDTNTHNRVVSEAYVNQYYNDLVNDRWPVNGEAIKVCEDGTLLDGQHRLLAVIKAQKPVTTLIVRGLPMSAQDTMDTGRNRTVRDALHIGGMPNASAVSAIANGLVRLKKSNRMSEFRFNRISNSEVQEFIRTHPNIANSATFATAFNGNPLPKSVIGITHYLATFVLNLGAEYEQFNAVMKTGLPSYEGDAAYYLREKLIRQRMSKTVFRPGDLIAMTLATFEHFVKRNPCTKIHMKTAVEFPGLDPSKI